MIVEPAADPGVKIPRRRYDPLQQCSGMMTYIHYEHASVGILKSSSFFLVREDLSCTRLSLDEEQSRVRSGMIR